MIEILNYLLIFLGFSVLIKAWLTPPSEQDAAFVRLSATFMAAFFLIPAFMFISSDGFFYLNEYRKLDQTQLLNTLVCFNLFLLGFFLIGKNKFILNKHKRNFPNDITSPENIIKFKISKSKLIFLSIVTIFVLTINMTMQPSVDILYASRQGELKISPIFLLLSVASNAAAISLFFLLAKMRWRVPALMLIFFLITVNVGASAGRTTMLLLLSISGIYIFNMRANTLAFVIPIILPFLLPVLLVGKTIIFYIGARNEIPRMSEIFSWPYDASQAYFENFSHPFLSMYEVFGTIELIGFRYFFDIFHGFLFYLRIFGIDMGSSLTYYNTENLMGLHESIVPTGYVAFGFIQAPYIGVVLMGAFYRYCYKFVTSTSLFRIARSQTFVFYASIFAANTFYTGEVRTLVLGFFLPVAIMHVYGKLAQTRVFVKRLLPRR